MRNVILVILIGLILGSIFKLAKWYDPELPMWVLAFMMACLAVNLKTIVDRIEKRA